MLSESMFIGLLWGLPPTPLLTDHHHRGRIPILSSVCSDQVVCVLLQK